MGGSRTYGKPTATQWFRDRFADNPAVSILDVGCGSGDWRHWLRRRRPDRWVGIEAWMENVQKFCLLGKYERPSRRGKNRGIRGPYDKVHVMDARDYVWDEEFDLVIFGDVLEHMPQDDAVFLTAAAREVAPAVLVSLPLGTEQGPVMGNPYQEHQHLWDWEQVDEAWPDADVLAVRPGKVVFVLEN